MEELRLEAEGVRVELASAELLGSKYTEGVVKLMIQSRLEILKTTLALIQQRIHAIESGVPVTISTQASKPNLERANQIAEEIKQQEGQLRKAEEEVSKYEGGLIQLMAITTAATQAQTLAMLRQNYLVAKLGLATLNSAETTQTRIAPAKGTGVSPGSADNSAPSRRNIKDEVIEVRLLRKELTKSDYQESLRFDIEYKATGLEKPSRAIKGVFILADLFGEAKLRVNWTIDERLNPLEMRTVKGFGFIYNQFTDSHQWGRMTNVESMTASFSVSSILYEDGTRRDFE